MIAYTIPFLLCTSTENVICKPCQYQIVCSTTLTDKELSTASEITMTTQFTVASGTIEQPVKLNTRQRQSPYMRYISMYHSKMATVMTGNSLTNYWKRIRAQIVTKPDSNQLPAFDFSIFFILIIQWL